jgi:hypothetical protein
MYIHCRFVINTCSSNAYIMILCRKRPIDEPLISIEQLKQMKLTKN